MNDLLSMREVEIIELVIQGYRYKELAETLFISEKTVKNHILHIKYKLMAFNKIDMIKKYNEQYDIEYRNELMMQEIKRLQRIIRGHETEIYKRNERVYELQELIGVE